MTAAKKRTIRTIPQERTRMTEREPLERARDFLEVACGYSPAEALREASRCLLCADEPCVRGCPVGIDIPGFIERLGESDVRGAYEVLARTTLLPAICGRVCPQETQCEGVCTVGDTLEPVAIGRLERFVGDAAIAEGWAAAADVEPSAARVAVIGSGPAGIACAADLARAGCRVTVFEAFQEPGGVLRYGIPEFRLPNGVVDAEIDRLARLGISFRCNTLAGRLFTVEQLLGEHGFDAVFIGTGAGAPQLMDIPGISLNGVVSANELLTRANLMRARDFPAVDTPLGVRGRVAVIGAGNTAMDALRVCLRIGAERVSCVYRRGSAEAPARAEELHHAEQEGIEFHWLTEPVAILDDGSGTVRGLRCRRMALGDPDASGRPRPVPIPNSEIDIECETVVVAIGTTANPILGRTSKLALDERGYIRVDDDLATSMDGVFAGGDIVTGAATVIEAMGAGRRAARSMKRYLGLDVDHEVPPSPDAEGTLFGIAPEQRVYARVRVA